jgi:hypothetical protein
MMFGAGLARLFPDLEGTATAATAVGCRLVTASKQLFAKRLFHGRSFEQQSKVDAARALLVGSTLFTTPVNVKQSDSDVNAARPSIYLFKYSRYANGI